MTAQYQQAVDAYELLKADDRDAFQLIADNEEPPNPVYTKILTQTMLGSPRSVYHGGLLRATVPVLRQGPRAARPAAGCRRPVDSLSADGVGIQLVNLSRTETRNVIVQAGALGSTNLPTSTLAGMSSRWTQILRGPASSLNVHPDRGGDATVRQRSQLCLPLARRRHSDAVSILTARIP